MILGETVALTSEGIVEFIGQQDHVSFAELGRCVEGWQGIVALHANADDNVVLWAGMSDEAASLVLDLIQSQQIHFHPCSHWVYLADGEVLRLPFVKKIPAGGYKKPHWLPVVLRLVSLDDTIAKRKVVAVDCF